LLIRHALISRLFLVFLVIKSKWVGSTSSIMYQIGIKHSPRAKKALEKVFPYPMDPIRYFQREGLPRLA
jgi:hypothetical protein